MKLKSVNQKNKSVSYTLPAPIKGLNARDSLANMDSEYAIVMDNYIPMDTKVMLRKGYIKYTNDLENICTLAEYKYLNERKFLAISNGKVYNITNADNIKQYQDVFFTNDFCRVQQYKNYMYFVNGNDIPKVFYIDTENNEHFENWSFITGDKTNVCIVNVSVSKQRLWFVEKNTMRVWYPEIAGNIAGTLQYFDFSTVSRFGGYLVAVANWTQDGGQGIDDLTVFITSEGEALVYSGSDINDADNWNLKGSFMISKPIGYNCLLSYQGDVIVISEDGYIPLSKALPLDRANASQFSFSDAIRSLIMERTANNYKKTGWQGIIYGKGGYAIFNVPLANQFEQHVINVNTGAWCRFKDINASCWCEYDGKMYFGANDGVFLFDESFSDNGHKICGVVEQAYNNLGTNCLKKIQLLNPRTKSIANYSLVVYTNMDMENRSIDYQESIGGVGITKWNKVKWSSSKNIIGTKWSTLKNVSLRSQWIANSATGYKASIVFKTKTTGNSIEWYETGIKFQVGEGIL